MYGVLDSWIDGDTLGAFEYFVKDKIPDIHHNVLKLIWDEYLNTYDRSALMYACDIKFFKAFHQRHLNDGLRTCPFPFGYVKDYCVRNNYSKLFTWLMKNGHTFCNILGMTHHLMILKCDYPNDEEILFLEIVIKLYHNNNKKQKI